MTRNDVPQSQPGKGVPGWVVVLVVGVFVGIVGLVIVMSPRP